MENHSKTEKRNILKAQSAFRRVLKEAYALIHPHDRLALSQVRYFESISIFSWRQICSFIFSPADLRFTGSHEYPINAAGFKIYYEMHRGGKITMYVGGDQREYHKEACLIMTILLVSHGLYDPDRLSVGFEPLTDWWFKANYSKLEPWCVKWIRENHNLVPPEVRQKIGEGYFGRL